MALKTTEDILRAARSLVQTVQADMRWAGSGLGRGYWQANSPQLQSVIRSRAAGALAFLDRFAGPSSAWAVQAHAVFTSNGERQSMESGARAVGDVLSEWASQIEAGITEPRIPLAGRAAATTDLMDQVRALNEDRSVHPAAPITLAGAAVEMALRAAVEDSELEQPEKPSMTAYARLLRQADVLTPQDMKDVEAIAGVRNTAAHGQLDDLTRERAGLLEQQVNLLLAHLPDRLAAATLPRPQ